MHALGLGTSGHHDPPRSPTRGATRRTGAGADSGLHSRVCAPSRDPGHDRAGRALVSASADAVFRAREDAPCPPDDGGSDEPRLVAEMAGERAKNANTKLRFCAAAPARGLIKPHRIRHQYQSVGEPRYRMLPAAHGRADARCPERSSFPYTLDFPAGRAHICSEWTVRK